MDPQLLAAIQALTNSVNSLNRNMASRPPATTTTSTTPTAATTGRTAGGGGSTGISGNGFNFQFDADKIGKDFEKTFSNVLELVQSKMVEISESFSSLSDVLLGFYKELDLARVQFIKLTGDIDGSADVYKRLSGRLRGLGLDYGQVSTTLADLTNQIPNFLTLSKKEQEAISVQSAALQRLGVDTNSYNKSLTFLNRVIGQSPLQSKKTIDSFYAFGKAVGIAPSIIMKDFASSQSVLSKFGVQAPNIFKDVSFYAKRLGIDVDTLIKGIDKFDTFESAAESAGSLNIILRENLFDTQELLFADPAEKVKIFVDRFQKLKNLTGQNFDQFDRFKKAQIAKASGFDVETLSKLSRMTLSELEKQKGNIKIAADGSVKIEEAAKKTISLNDRLQMLKEQIISAFMPLMKFLEPIISSISGYIKIFVGAVDKVFTKFPGLKNTLAGLVSGFAAFKALDSAGITGIFGKIFNPIISFIPFGKELSGLVIPGIGAALASVVAKEGAEGAAGRIGKMLGLDPQQTKEIEKQLKSVIGFVEDSFKSFLKFLNFQDADVELITKSIKDSFVGMYDILFGDKGDGGVFGNISKVFGAFFEGFKDNMKTDTESNPFLKFVKSITFGLKTALTELEKVFGSGATGGEETPTQKILREFGETMKSFGEGVKKAFLGVFASLFPTGGGGILDTLSNFVDNPIIKEFGSTILGTLKEMFTGIGNVFSFFTSGIDANKVASSLSTVMDALKASFADISIDKDSDDLGVAAGGVAELAKNIGNVNQKTVETFTTSLKDLMPIFADLSKIDPINQNFIESIKKLTEALTPLNQQLGLLGQTGNNIKILASTTDKEVEHVERIATAVQRYAKAIEDTRKYAAEQDKMNELIKGVTNLAGTLKMEVDADAIGNIVGAKVAQAIASRFGGR